MSDNNGPIPLGTGNTPPPGFEVEQNPTTIMDPINVNSTEQGQQTPLRSQGNGRLNRAQKRAIGALAAVTVAVAGVAGGVALSNHDTPAVRVPETIQFVPPTNAPKTTDLEDPTTTELDTPDTSEVELGPDGSPKPTTTVPKNAPVSSTDTVIKNTQVRSGPGTTIPPAPGR